MPAYWTLRPRVCALEEEKPQKHMGFSHIVTGPNRFGKSQCFLAPLKGFYRVTAVIKDGGNLSTVRD